MTKTLQRLLEFPKLMALALSCFLAYVLYHNGAFDFLHALRGYGYISIFFGGLLFSFGFTTPFAIAIFIELAPDIHPLMGAVIAGIGACMADVTIFNFIRFSFHDEVENLKHTRWFRFLYHLVHNDFISDKFRMYLLWSVAGLVIASPFPDEIAVSMISSIGAVKQRTFMAFCFALNTVGVFLVLAAAA